jgi:3-oxoadipate enol-lactonase
MKTAAINDLNLSFVDEGSGTVLLLVHGFPLDHTMWEGQIENLSKKHRVIAPDLPGFGQSDVGDDVATMAQFADDLVELLDFLMVDEPVVLCGLSMGGYIALEFWRLYAERLRGLILCDTRAANDAPEAAAARLTVAQRVLDEGTHFLLESMIPKLLASATFEERPHLAEALRRVIHRTDPRGIAAAARGMAERADFTAELPRIACPTLVLVGENDAVSPVAEMQELAKAIPNAEFKIIPHAGHMSPFEQPDAVNAAIESFLKGIVD